MEEELYKLVRKVFDSEERDELSNPQKLTEECFVVTKALCMVMLNKKLKTKLTPENIEDQKILSPMYLANMWGLHTYLKQLRLGKVYVSPAIYENKAKVTKASKAASQILVNPPDIDRVAETVMDTFAELMMPSLADTGMRIGKKYYRQLLEVNLRWGYEFAREASREVTKI